MEWECQDNQRLIPFVWKYDQKVRTILDINCGFGSFGAHLLSLEIMAVCIAAYDATGSQVQLSPERGLPAMIGNFIARQLPYPSLSYDIVHCAQCGIIWDEKDGLFLIEVDRVLCNFNLLFSQLYCRFSACMEASHLPWIHW